MLKNPAIRLSAALAVMSPLLLGGCASPDAIKQAQDTANAAKAEADQTLATAQQALQVAQAANSAAQTADQAANKAEADAQTAIQTEDKMFQHSLKK